MSVLEAHPLTVAARCIADGEPAALATVIAADGSTPRQPGAKMVVFPDGRTIGSVGGGRLEHDTIQAALETLQSGQPARVRPSLSDDLGMCCVGNVEVFVEPLKVAAPAFIYGAGHIARAVAPLLQQLSLRVTVVDDRTELLTEERFPGCTLSLMLPEAHAAGFPVNPRAHVLVMTHDHGRDIAIVTALMHQPLAYLGMLGARRKRLLLQDRLSAIESADFGVLERLRAPIGLDIGASNPTEIAIAVAAEIIAERQKGASTPDPSSR